MNADEEQALREELLALYNRVAPVHAQHVTDDAPLAALARLVTQTVSTHLDHLSAPAAEVARLHEATENMRLELQRADKRERDLNGLVESLRREAVETARVPCTVCNPKGSSIPRSGPCEGCDGAGWVDTYEELQRHRAGLREANRRIKLLAALHGGAMPIDLATHLMVTTFAAEAADVHNAAEWSGVYRDRPFRIALAWTDAKSLHALLHEERKRLAWCAFRLLNAATVSEGTLVEALEMDRLAVRGLCQQGRDADVMFRAARALRMREELGRRLNEASHDLALAEYEVGRLGEGDTAEHQAARAQLAEAKRSWEYVSDAHKAHLATTAPR